MTLDIRIDASEVTAALDKLDAKASATAVKAAVRKGGQVLKPPMKAAAPVGPTRNLRKKVGVRVRKSRQEAGSYYAAVRSFSRHHHLVVSGTVQRFTKSGASRGRMPSNPFVSEVADRYEDQAIREAHEELLRQLDL